MKSKFDEKKRHFAKMKDQDGKSEHHFGTLKHHYAKMEHQFDEMKDQDGTLKHHFAKMKSKCAKMKDQTVEFYFQGAPMPMIILDFVFICACTEI